MIHVLCIYIIHFKLEYSDPSPITVVAFLDPPQNRKKIEARYLVIILFTCIFNLTKIFVFRKMEGMAAESSIPSPLSWLQLESWLCRSMMKPERWAPFLGFTISKKKKNDLQLLKYLIWLCILTCLSARFLVCLPITRASLCGLWWSWHWSANQRLGKRLPRAGGHAWASGRHDGEGKDWSGLLQVSISLNTKP